MRKFAGWYGILVGLLMFGQWGFFLATGQVPELRTEPIRLYFHLAGEFCTALCLLIGGLALLNRRRWAETVYLVAAGMLLYSLIVSPGYFAQHGQWVLLAMFAILLALAVVGIVVITRAKGA